MSSSTAGSQAIPDKLPADPDARYEVAADFVNRFARSWKAGSPDALVTILEPAIRLRQPLMPPVDGLDRARVAFSRLTEVLPGLTAEVSGWGVGAESLFIEFDLIVPGPPIVRWGAVDRFRLVGERAFERITYFDYGELISGIAKRPWLALRAVAGGFVSLGSFPRRHSDGIDFRRHTTSLGPVAFREFAFGGRAWGTHRPRWLGVTCKDAESIGSERLYFSSPTPYLLPKPILRRWLASN